MDLTQPEKGITGVEGIDAALDIPLNILQGGAAGVRMLANVFGAGSEFSENVKGVEDYFGDLMSASAKEDKEEIARIMSDAEDKGLLPQVKAAVDAFTTAPVDIVANTLGASAPIIIAGLKSAVAAPLVAFAQGMGIVKGALYDAVKEELPKSDRNLSEEEIEKLAQDSQSYTGENKLSIAIGGALGLLAGRGIEPKIIDLFRQNAIKKISEKTGKNFVKDVIRASVKETIPEVAQAGQEKLAENIALQKLGFDVPTFRGVVGQATLEGLAGLGLGAATEVAVGTQPEVEESKVEESKVEESKVEKSRSEVESETEEQLGLSEVENEFNDQMSTILEEKIKEVVSDSNDKVESDLTEENDDIARVVEKTKDIFAEKGISDVGIQRKMIETLASNLNLPLYNKIQENKYTESGKNATEKENLKTAYINQIEESRKETKNDSSQTGGIRVRNESNATERTLSSDDPIIETFKRAGVDFNSNDIRRLVEGKEGEPTALKEDEDSFLFKDDKGNETLIIKEESIDVDVEESKDGEEIDVEDSKNVKEIDVEKSEDVEKIDVEKSEDVKKGQGAFELTTPKTELSKVEIRKEEGKEKSGESYTYTLANDTVIKIDPTAKDNLVNIILPERTESTNKLKKTKYIDNAPIKKKIKEKFKKIITEIEGKNSKDIRRILNESFKTDFNITAFDKKPVLYKDKEKYPPVIKSKNINAQTLFAPKDKDKDKSFIDKILNFIGGPDFKKRFITTFVDSTRIVNTWQQEVNYKGQLEVFGENRNNISNALKTYNSITANLFQQNFGEDINDIFVLTHAYAKVKKLSLDAARSEISTYMLAKHFKERQKVLHAVGVELVGDNKKIRDDILKKLRTEILSEKEAKGLRKQLDDLILKEVVAERIEPFDVIDSNGEYKYMPVGGVPQQFLDEQFNELDNESTKDIVNKLIEIQRKTLKLNKEANFMSEYTDNFINFYGWENYIPLKNAQEKNTEGA